MRTPHGVGTAQAASSPRSHPLPRRLSAGEALLGLRYLWGGLSAWGFDCSGLVWDVFRVQGMTVPRDADPQFQHGNAVAQGSLRPGDLVF